VVPTRYPHTAATLLSFVITMQPKMQTKYSHSSHTLSPHAAAPLSISQGVARKFVHERMKWKVCFDNGSNAEISEGNLIRAKNRRDSMPTLGHKPLDPIRRETQPAACCFERVDPLEDLRMGAFRTTRYSLGRADGGGNLLPRAHSAYLPTIHVEVGGADDELLPSIAERKKDLVQQFVSRTNWKQSLESRQGSRTVSRFKLVDNGGVAVMEEIWSQDVVCEKKKMEEDFKQVCFMICPKTFAGCGVSCIFNCCGDLIHLKVCLFHLRVSIVAAGYFTRVSTDGTPNWWNI